MIDNWYVIFTKPRQELQAVINLSNQGFEVFYPKIRILKRVKGKLLRKIEPLFPRYIFISLNADIDNWISIKSTKGVKKLVEFGGKPAMINSSFIKILKDKSDVHGVSDFDEEPILYSGKEVSIGGGIFAGTEAIFHKYLGKDRVELMMQFASHQTKVSLSINDLL